MQGGSELLTHAGGAGDAAPAPGHYDDEETKALRELCHDLIEPAASIKLLAHAARASAGPDLAVRQRLELIAAEAGRIADICGQMLNRPVPRQLARLDELAEESAASARLRYAGTIEVVSEPVLLAIHPAVAARILGNLLSNACRAAGDAGRVRVEIAAHAATARLAVADSGSGLQPGPAGRASRPSLGLEIIGSLVLGCGGTLHLGGSDLGGLCVTVLLPYEPDGDRDGEAAVR